MLSVSADLTYRSINHSHISFLLEALAFEVS